MGNTTTTNRPHRLGGHLRAVIAAVAVAGLALTAGTGFMLQSNLDQAKRSVEQTDALRSAAELEPAQLGTGRDILLARAGGAADTAVAEASAVLAAATGKADASALASTVAQLDGAALLAPDRVFALVATARAQSAEVASAVAEFDRIAAEQAAAAEAARIAAEQEAAERAAAERAASGGSGSGGSGSSGGGGGGTPAAPANPSAAQQIGREMGAARYGWGDDQFGCLVAVWNYESGWNVYASNPSGAYGIPQALPGSKMASHGADWQTNPATQISWGIDYIAGRYGNPCGAWAHIQSTGWY
ncbi:transglycosylase SLT domain-containing protein [Agromyces sp. MMS24-K17]|uniref:aggregation-promoting factor C-terminal-like domain-containing protein n=1 Tax=Agromyces sp. MMS24-K17 TaxID=3372850 RepID=UPI0037542FD2